MGKNQDDQYYPGPQGGGDVVSSIGEVNHILIVARGPQFLVYLNGVPVAYVEDQDFDVPHRMVFHCKGQPDAVCKFDNVKVWNLDNVPGLP